MSDAEGRALHRDLLETIAARSGEFPQGKAEVLEALAPHDAFDLLAALQISSARVWPKGRNPPLHSAEVTRELLALLLRERASRAPTAEGPSDEAAFVDAMRRYESFAEGVVALLPDLLVPPPPPPDQSQEAELDRIRSRMASLHILLPFSEADDQAERATEELFEAPPVRAHLVEALGIDADAALALMRAAGTLAQRGYDDAFQEERLESWRGHGQRLSLSVQELAELAAVEPDQAERFVARFSLSFDGSPYELGALTTAARLHPLLRDGDRLMPISLPTLRRTLRGSLAALLNPHLPAAGAGDKRAFSIFTAERGKWLEQRAAQTLQQGLRPEWIELNVYFQTPDGRGGEVDALVRLDDTLLMVQAKAGATRVDTEVGDRERFRETITALIGGENFRQHRDAIAALSTGSTLSRDPAGREPLGRNLTGISRILPLHITLDDLSAIGSQPWLLADAGLAVGDELPWIVGVDRMELLLEYFEQPAVFVHFLTRRLKANRSRQLLAHDEIDWAVRYGKDELLWAELSPDHPYAQRQFAVLEEHYDFDLWQLARQIGEKAKRPRPDISAGVRRLLARLERSRPTGWLDFSLALLDLTRMQRPAVVNLWQRQLDSNRAKEAPPLNVGFGPDGDIEIGFSVLREERELPPDVSVLLQTFCEEQLFRYGARQWWAIVAPYRKRDPVRWCCSLRA